jgi:hypothetical protein
VKKHKASENVAKVTVSHVYGKSKTEDQTSPPSKPKNKIMKKLTSAEKDELIEMLL